MGKQGACHLFRHTAATLMLEGGADVRYIQAMLGHVSLATTQIYTHVTIAKLREVHEKTHPARLFRPTGQDAEGRGRPHRPAARSTRTAAPKSGATAHRTTWTTAATMATTRPRASSDGCRPLCCEARAAGGPPRGPAGGFFSSHDASGWTTMKAVL